ncbi:hypothetical protein [Streptomyces sp. NPDC001781]
MSAVYEADPSGLRRSIEEMKSLPALARRMVQDFRHHESAYTPWPGWTDDFARQVRPQYQRNNTYCADIVQELYEALDALVSATLTNLENIESTRSDATDRIEAHGRRVHERPEATGGQGKH